jgi:hypothetical protein
MQRSVRFASMNVFLELHQNVVSILSDQELRDHRLILVEAFRYWTVDIGERTERNELIELAVERQLRRRWGATSTGTCSSSCSCSCTYSATSSRSIVGSVKIQIRAMVLLPLHATLDASTEQQSCLGIRPLHVTDTHSHTNVLGTGFDLLGA